MGEKMFLEIEGHKSSFVGADPAHQGWIPILVMDIGDSIAGLRASRKGSRKPGEAGGGAVRVVKAVDNSTAFISEAMIRGTIFPGVKIDLCETKNERVIRRIMRYIFSDAVVSGFRSLRESVDGVTGEEVFFNARNVTFEYNR